ncbi:uncharacterized protein FIBRA_00257 [Fibroporia radiculosa]|uniref:Uncharacterized protein n=1 Tax=Fibroporia radiculosa TaxID=599839 RepID=J7SCN3_9APHY|nr:uncharacterized protein FIBRA_00257 [Fibroporia radiculosa]CCL98263.1 predicted protein [Fibroporia radiculosa]
MVFSFFSGKKQQPLAPPEFVPLPPSPSHPATQLPQSQLVFEAQTQTQLRTPSPSVASVSLVHCAPQSPSPATKMARLSVDEHARQVSPTRQSTSRMTAPVFPTQFIPPEATAESLTTHISSIPAKVVHSYIISQVPRASEDILSALANFFSELSPPPRLHCVRCHKDYTEVDNDDRSCLVPHDDESAEVERVGRNANRGGRSAGDPGTTYETIWGCCGKVTEGNGDQGPPDGWCYEGKHTTDTKRARFRADSTPQNDKLISCLRLNCHGIRDQLPRASLRKRRRSVNLKEPDTDEDASKGDPDSGVDEIVGRIPKNKGKGKEKAKSVDDEQMDVDQDMESASRAGSPRGRPRARAKSTTTPSANAPKRRGRPPKAKATVETDGEDADADDTTSVRSAPTAPKRRGRKPKSKAYISDSDAEGEERRGPRTRSQSRTRAATSSATQKPLSMAASASAKPKSRVRKAKATDDNDIDVSRRGDGDTEDQPKKKRRVAA